MPLSVPSRSVAVVLALLASGPGASAQAPGIANPMAAIRANQWQAAQEQVGRFADPVTDKLVLYYRLLAPGAATPAEIADFMGKNPDWPGQALLEHHRQEAIASDPDPADVLAQCAAGPPTQANAMLRCGEALANAGRTQEANGLARRTWIETLNGAEAEAAFLRRWGSLLTSDDQWDRFRRLAWHDPADAARQMTRLAGPHHATAEAWLALKRDAPSAEAALPPVDQQDPGLFLDHVRSLRRTGALAAALALWQQNGAAAQRAAPDRPADFWNERDLLARKLLETNENAGAYAMVADPGPIGPEQLLDADFLAGFIALRRLNDPGHAAGHFQGLAKRSPAAITQGRAWYWLGRAQQAAGQDPTASWRNAAQWATTFYGQLAAVALGEDTAALSRRIEALRDPAFTRETALGFAGHQVVRAALWLVAWGEVRRAQAFLLRMDELAPAPGERTLTADLALQLGLPDTAVFVARRVGRDGGMLPQAGWPIPYTPPPPLDPAIALGVMRQESSFDVGAVSPSGARGLMQLMPFTAAAVAKELSIKTSLPSLTADPDHNMRLGTTYVQEMLDHFGGSLPLAVAAYNAGPHRVDQWLALNGDPRGGKGTPTIAMLDWLELIPVAETRNYVQRVLENVTVYRARRNEATPTLQAQWTH
jgi:soluble lytic murein transglycosylase